MTASRHLEDLKQDQDEKFHVVRTGRAYTICQIAKWQPLEPRCNVLMKAESGMLIEPPTEEKKPLDLKESLDMLFDCIGRADDSAMAEPDRVALYERRLELLLWLLNLEKRLSPYGDEQSV